jgi:mannose-6-phosphate isomerase-like protein (cupin superfamily)
MRVSAAAGGLVLLLVGCVPRSPVNPAGTGSAATAATTPRGSLIPLHAGTPLVFCRTPGLSVNVKVDSVATGATRFAAGTAELAPGAVNAAAHASNDEAIYFLSAGGRAFVAADTIDIHVGLMLYVPQGVHHGFVSAPDSPVRFVWMIAPQDLARGFRARGVPPGSACPAPRP